MLIQYKNVLMRAPYFYECSFFSLKWTWEPVLKYNIYKALVQISFPATDHFSDCIVSNVLWSVKNTVLFSQTDSHVNSEYKK